MIAEAAFPELAQAVKRFEQGLKVTNGSNRRTVLFATGLAVTGAAVAAALGTDSAGAKEHTTDPGVKVEPSAPGDSNIAATPRPLRRPK
jgi:hypothetical protein